MKVNPRVSPADIDKLLNSFLDGELPVRQLTEVQRLLAGNKKLAQRLDQLRRCRALLQAVPYAQAPVGILESVKASVAANAALTQKAPPVDDVMGIKHLMFRKLLTAAAMFVLVAVLATVIYSIVSPRWGTTQPRPGEMVRTPGSETRTGTGDPVADIRGKLELTTVAFTDAGAAINTAIKDTNLDDFVIIDRLPQRMLYTLTCPRNRLDSLLTRLERDWPMFDSATLVLQADVPTDRVEVAGVRLEQVARILSEDDLDRRTRAAKYFAVANGAPDIPVEDVQTPDSMTIPKPVLTGERPTDGTDARQLAGETIVSLTLVLTAREQ